VTGARSIDNAGTTDAADLELSALPSCDRNKEHRELFVLAHPHPLRGVVAARTGPDLPRAERLLLDAVPEKEKQHDNQRRDDLHGGWTPPRPVRWRARAGSGMSSVIGAYRVATLISLG
jgi:hypothetical protein